ncbi:MAG: fasciclin domain-containing protein [Cyanobacteria bacterium J06600_6]
MLSSKFLQKSILTALLIGSTATVTKIVSAQSPFYYYPSASFFSPAAFTLQSQEGEGAVPINAVLESGFSTFNSNLQATELSEIIEQSENLTVLAPTEAAFAALSPELQDKLADPETLAKVLKYHLVIGNISEEDIKRRGVSTMLEQNAVAIGGVEGKDNEVTVMLNDATASEPLPADNGMVIPIDKVLIPANL